jgi:hypothetical protein
MINDYYYNIVSKQQSSELHAQADLDRLAKQVRLQRRVARAARREAARLDAAVNGRQSGLWSALRTLVTPNGFAVGGADAAVATRPTPDAELAPTEKRVTVER